MKESSLALVGRHLEAENRHDLEATLATLHPDCVFQDHALGWTFRGRSGAARYYGLWWSAFDLVVRGERRYRSDDGALIAEARFTGRQVGSFCGIAATGRELDLRIVVIVEFRDGLMAGERFYYDSRSLFTQLGQFDTEPTRASRSSQCVWPSLAQPA
jgi:steroid delta-isomerase-like uncharacterized protein